MTHRPMSPDERHHRTVAERASRLLAARMRPLTPEECAELEAGRLLPVPEPEEPGEPEGR